MTSQSVGSTPQTAAELPEKEGNTDNTRAEPGSIAEDGGSAKADSTQSDTIKGAAKRDAPSAPAGGESDRDSSQSTTDRNGA